MDMCNLTFLSNFWDLYPSIPRLLREPNLLKERSQSSKDEHLIGFCLFEGQNHRKSYRQETEFIFLSRKKIVFEKSIRTTLKVALSISTNGLKEIKMALSIRNNPFSSSKRITILIQETGIRWYFELLHFSEKILPKNAQ